MRMQVQECKLAARRLPVTRAGRQENLSSCIAFEQTRFRTRQLPVCRVSLAYTAHSSDGGLTRWEMARMPHTSGGDSCLHSWCVGQGTRAMQHAHAHAMRASPCRNVMDMLLLVT